MAVKSGDGEEEGGEVQDEGPKAKNWEKWIED